MSVEDSTSLKEQTTPLLPLVPHEPQEDYFKAVRKFKTCYACVWWTILALFLAAILGVLIYLALSKSEIKENAKIWGASPIGTDVCCTGLPESCGPPAGPCVVCNATAGEQCTNQACQA
jgi:hypothetical protein